MRKVFGVVFVMAMFAIGLAVPSFAAFDYTNAFTGVSTELTTALTAIVPLVVAVLALILGIRLAIAFFRRVASR